MSLGRHPLAGLALGFAAVAGAFTVNMLIKPLDAVLVEFTNDAIHLVDPNASIGLASNLWFSIASVPFLTVVVAFITERVIEPRLGKYNPDHAAAESEEKPAEDGQSLSADESRGLRYACFALVGVLAVFGTPHVARRSAAAESRYGRTDRQLAVHERPDRLHHGDVPGDRRRLRLGAGTMKSLTDIIKAMEKAMSGLGGLILLFLVLSQFVAYFNYTNMGTILAVKMADVLKDGHISVRCGC